MSLLKEVYYVGYFGAYLNNINIMNRLAVGRLARAQQA